MSDPRWLDTYAAAGHIGLSPDAFRRRVKAGTLPKPSEALGPRNPRWDRAALDAAMTPAGLVIEQDWQPIETAPRDGRPMLATTFPKKAVFIVHWDGWDWVDAGGGLRDPTHYRPLPTPPEGQP